MNARISSIALCAMLAACSSSTSPADPRALSLAGGGPAVLLVDSLDDWPHDPWQFGSMRLVADTLTVSITHGGGCATHEYALLVANVFLESWPVQMHGALAHDAHDDPCDALLTPSLRFDLSPVRDAYRRAYQTQSGAITLHIRDWPQSIEYRF